MWTWLEGIYEGICKEVRCRKWRGEYFNAGRYRPWDIGGNFMTENPTFRSGENFHLNACVGKNGINDFDAYEHGYDLAVNIMLEHAIKNIPLDDTIVYPMIFCARHRIELFIKKIIFKLYYIKSLYGPTDNRLLLIHDIDRLWEHLVELSKFDERYKEYIDELGNFISDYRIDPTGEAFRYPFDVDEKHCLDELYHINVEIYKKGT